MAKGIENHTVSLTKNGYFKLRELIAKYPSNQVLNHLHEISLDWTQALKMLAGNEGRGTIPSIWDEVRLLQTIEQDALLMISIIFSHRDLIRVFQDSTQPTGRGRITRASLETKTYTNLAYAMDQLGLAVDFQQGSADVSYDWNRILTPTIGKLAKEIIRHQLQRMGWSEPDPGDPFTRDFYEQAAIYEFPKVFGMDEVAFRDWLEGQRVTLSQPPVRSWGFQQFLNEFGAAMSDAGLRTSADLRMRFVAALLTKPFVIFTGLAGSGKTKLAQALAYWLCEDASQVAIVPVGADWTNREPLLGYPNALERGNYCRPDNGVLDLILEASKGINAYKPYFLILDEMNLSHVERYFADFLSAMESKESIPLHADGEEWAEDGTPARIGFPPNLFIIGTVNIDETTYMFSPKVLDRAQVIEFRVSREEMDAFLDGQIDIQMEALSRKGAPFGAGFTLVSQMRPPALSDETDIRGTLLKFFDKLQSSGAEFGFRTADEIQRFIRVLNIFNTEQAAAVDLKAMMDAAIVQKLLPKIHGSRRKLEPLLRELAALCVDTPADLGIILNPSWTQTSPVGVRFPLSLAKIASMGQRVVQNGFSSFAEA